MILLASYSYALGGAERLLIELAAGLEGDCWLACPPGPLAAAAGEAGIHVVPLRPRSLRLRGRPVSAARELAGHARELRRLARDLRPEALVAWNMRPALACALGRVGVPVVFQHNDFVPGPLVGRLVRAAAARAEVVVVVSDTVARDLDPQGRLGRRMHVVHPGIDVDDFGLPELTANAAAPTVVVIGALVPWKRPELALEAFGLLRPRRPDAVLRFVGGMLEDPTEAKLCERASALAPEAVEFAGEVADVREELARASCLLHCAEREPFGRVVLEALAARRPVVVPDSDSGVAEIVDASCALTYPPGDARAAAAAIERLLGDPGLAARMGEAGRARARREFDQGAARRRWVAAVRSVAAGPARARAAGAGAPSITIVTVTHNSAATLGALLESAQRHLPGAHVVVVDCASGDGSLAVAQERPGTETITLSENVGFGRGCNRGVAAVRTPLTILLNPDVELLDDSLLDLAAEALAPDRPERLLAPLVLSPDGSRQDSAHPPPTSVPDLIRSLVSPRLVSTRRLAPWRSTSPVRVGWAVGCALVARTETLRRLGPFDERLFLYGEDLDLGLRAAAEGVETWFWPSARVLHHRAHATTAAFGGEPFERLAGARREVVARRLGERRALIDDAAQAATFASRIAVKRLLGRSAERERRQLAALHAVRR